MCAAYRGHNDVVKMLREFGADVNRQNEVGCWYSVQFIRYQSDFTVVM